MNNALNHENIKILKRYKLNCKNRGLTEKSIKAICDNDLRLFLEFLRDKSLNDVTHNDIEDFLIYCQDERKNNDEALSRKYTSLHQFFKILIVQEMIEMKANPVSKLDKPKVRKKVRPYLTLDEYLQILNYIDSKNDLRGAALFSIFFSSGCRLSEIWQLNRDSLDFEKRRFKILGKGKKERIATFSVDSKERILKYLESRIDDLEPLFISSQKKRWSTKAIQDYVKITAKRAGIKKNIHPHILRHGRAMYLLKKGAQLEVIQRHLGHESIATTQIYAHMDIDSVQNKIDELDEVI